MAGADTIEKLRERLLYAAGKYSDYARYSSTLSWVEDEYDETLEIYNLAIWGNHSSGTIREKAGHMLRVTAELFQDMENNAEMELYHVMEEIMELDGEEQLKIWNVVLDREKMTEDELMEIITDWSDYEYNQESALESFLDYLKIRVGEREA